MVVVSVSILLLAAWLLWLFLSPFFFWLLDCCGCFCPHSSSGCLIAVVVVSVPILLLAACLLWLLFLSQFFFWLPDCCGCCFRPYSSSGCLITVAVSVNNVVTAAVLVAPLTAQIRLMFLAMFLWNWSVRCNILLYCTCLCCLVCYY